jgi:sulfur carrier protein ThiS
MEKGSATIILKNKSYQVQSGIPLHKALKILNITANAHLAIRNKEMITEDEMLKNGDRIELIAVISGG